MRRNLCSAMVLGGVLALLVFLLSPRPAPAALEDAAPPAAGEAHPSSEAVKKDLTTVIEAQLAAFRTEDYPKAYTFAASEIRGALGVAEFEKMVKTGYPAIAHSSGVKFGLVFDSGDEAVVNVRIESTDRKGGNFQYLLKKQDGKWKVGGVEELKPEGLTV